MQQRQAVTITQHTPEGSKAIAQAMFDRIFPVSQNIVASGQEHIAVMFVERLDGQVAMLPLLAGLDKAQIAAMHQRFGASPNVRCACLVMEAWVYEGDGGEPARKILEAVQSGRLSLADVPGSTECVMFNIISGDKQWLARCPIARPANTVTKGELFDPNPGDGAHSARGRMVKGDAARRMN